MAKKFNKIVFVGRFEPPTNPHIETINRAAEMADEVELIIGSAYQPRTFKNPWTNEEREEMLRAATVYAQSIAKINFFHNIDTRYDDTAWILRVQKFANQQAGETVGIIGHKKDGSSEYLDMFPQWELIEQPLLEPLNATNIRELYFRPDANMNFIKGVVPPAVADYLEKFRNTPEYEVVLSRRRFIDKYKKQFAHLPYPPIFVTVDSVVVQCGHVLMIQRKSEPGKDLWALPGGFVNADTDKSVEAAMLRELREETGLKVPEKVLAGSIKDSNVFDAIDRSERGRTITHAFKIVLPDGPLPKVKGMDDAKKARWVPITSIDPRECFEDHAEIISYFVNGTVG